MKTALLIMAAGLGSRFGGGIKQLTPIGPNGEIIIDYSIHDAIEARFDKIIFIIRRDIEDDFRRMVSNRVEQVCHRLGVEVAYAYQDLTDLPHSCEFPDGRTKPWGTGQAVLAARRLIDTPFAVINADDYYGKKAYHLLHAHLISDNSPNCYAMAGFILGNTLSENGGVTRGICEMDGDWLTDVMETREIVKTAAGAAANEKAIDPSAIVSMNMWGLKKEFIPLLEQGFEDFLNHLSDPIKDEYLLPVFLRSLLKKNQISIKVLRTNNHWFGVTYKQDCADAVRKITYMIQNGVYDPDLYSDLAH